MSDVTPPLRWPSNIPVPDPSLLTTEALDREVRHLRELMDRRIDARVELVDEKIASVRRALHSRDEAVAAALAAAKEAVGKAEVATNIQLAALQKNLDTEVRALREQIGDVKENAAGGAGRGAGKEYALGVAIVVAAALLAFIGPLLTR